MIEWTLEAARGSRYDNRLVVSTDSPEIAGIARLMGADVPFLRPPELSADHTSSIEVVLHALDWLEREQNFRPDYIVLLQPTSPLRIADDIDDAINLALDRDAPAVISVSPISCHPFWMKKIGPEGALEDFIQQSHPAGRRQDLPNVYGLNGAIYLIKRQVLLEQRTWCPALTLATVMPPERALDIDEPWDLHLADLILCERIAGTLSTKRKEESR